MAVLPSSFPTKLQLWIPFPPFSSLLSSFQPCKYVPKVHINFHQYNNHKLLVKRIKHVLIDKDLP